MIDEALLRLHLAPGAPVLLALSGGTDSSGALLALHRFCAAEGHALAAAHLDHAIRPESEADARFCADLCRGLGVKLYSRRTDVPALAAARRIGLEEAARDARYAYFAELMETEQIPVLVTAHHAEDNLETLLMHLTRGCGLRGLCGIPPVRRFGPGLLLRPFLAATKADLARLCADAGITPCTDATNADTRYTRNRIRAEVIPVLRDINPALFARSADTIASLREIESALTLGAERMCTPDLTAAQLADTPPPYRWRMLTKLVADAGGGPLETVHLRALDRLLATGRGIVALPGECSATVENGALTLTHRPARPRNEK